jgi:hypothetical protein
MICQLRESRELGRCGNLIHFYYIYTRYILKIFSTIKQIACLVGRQATPDEMSGSQ